MHATLSKFGYPASALVSLDHWIVVLRPQQITLASLVLIAKSDSVSFSTLPKAAHAELSRATHIIEAGLRNFEPYDRINYLMLMMVDPHVHMHVLPRYGSVKAFAGMDFHDSAWPGPPDLKVTTPLAESVFQSLHEKLKASLQEIAHQT
jgi:diadenosine tetraphosphate (Ap4A) HIT family hydrolase